MNTLVNDVHSRLNPTRVREIAMPASPDDVVTLVERARRESRSIAVCGGRHAMGGQQFAEGEILLDSRELRGTEALDADGGLLSIGAGSDWTRVVASVRSFDGRGGEHWGIRQKQTGADALTLAGSLSCNGHGRGLRLGPIVEDVEAFELVTPDARRLTCTRDLNPELFSLAIGGYGLFGIITNVTLRLTRRVKCRRVVDIIDLDDAVNAARRRIAEGCLYGDFQYAIDPADDSFLRRGVLCCYRPVPDTTPVDDNDADLSHESWLKLLHLAHTDKARAFQLYSAHYLGTHGRVYWSDTMQLSTYLPSYSEFLARSLGSTSPESLMISELYVPHDTILEFMTSSRDILRAHGVEDIYGTIRLIEPDATTYLPWARQAFACVIFNLRTRHDGDSISRTADASRALIDAAANLGGTFYLTYHRWATREQLLRCHPRLRDFLEEKRARDPKRVLTSTWHRHIEAVLGVSDGL